VTKPVWIVLIIIFLLIFSAVIIGFQTSRNIVQNTLPTTPTSSSSAQTTPPRYRIFDQNTLTDTSDTRRVLFFYASWCPTCIPADQDLLRNQDQIPTDVTVIRVNYNDPDTDATEKELAKKYGITYQHTFVQIDSTDQVVTKWNGGRLKELLSNLK
jgi:thiol-disulfide isomerase/thioredoxin